MTLCAIFILSGFVSQCFGASCNEEQIEICTSSGSTTSNWGECSRKPYMEFSHLCLVSNYLPSVDFCCCNNIGHITLCCRYHQDWNHFRCHDDDDVIDGKGTKTTERNIANSSEDSHVTSWIVFVLVTSSPFVACFLFCLFRCCWPRCREDDDDLPSIERIENSQPPKENLHSLENSQDSRLFSFTVRPSSRKFFEHLSAKTHSYSLPQCFILSEISNMAASQNSHPTEITFPCRPTEIASLLECSDEELKGGLRIEKEMELAQNKQCLPPMYDMLCISLT